MLVRQTERPPSSTHRAGGSETASRVYASAAAAAAAAAAQQQHRTPRTSPLGPPTHRTPSGFSSLPRQPSWQFKCKRQLALKHKAEKRHNTAGRLAGKSCSWTSLGSSASSCGCYWCIACGVCLEKPPKTVGLRSSKFKSENGTKETKDRCAVRSAGRSAVVRGLCPVLGSPNGGCVAAGSAQTPRGR